MDIFNNPVLAKVIIAVGVVVLMILYGLVRMIYVSLSSKRNTPVKKEESYRSREPMSRDESIGDISTRLGDDVRDVWEMGFSDGQINDVLTGQYTLTELYTKKPEGNKRTAKGQEILSRRGDMAK